MKEVVMYQASDESLHKTKEQCESHELKCKMLERIHNELGRYSDSDDIYDWIIKNTLGFKEYKND